MSLDEAFRHPDGDAFSLSHILLLEDEPLIALDIEQTLESEGFVVKLCGSRAEAMDWLQSAVPAAAIINLHLRDGISTDVVAKLHVTGVPVVICSGSHRGDIAINLGDVAWVAKPHSEQQILTALKAAIKAGHLPHMSEVAE